jgi:prevent-host-death family protein
MREIGVRELKRALSETLRAVGRGEQVRVTLRGRPIADIVPAGAAAGDDRLRELVAEGRLAPPSRSRPPRPPQPPTPPTPATPPTAERSASALVLSERDDER